MGRRDDGRQSTRGIEAKGGIRTRGRAREDARGRRAGADGRSDDWRRKKGVGTSDSNYLELRADDRPIPPAGPRGFSRRATTHAVTFCVPHSL